MEATSPETRTEGTEEVSASVEGTAESTEQTPDTGANSDVDWNDESLFKDVPEDAREMAKQYGEKVFKRAYTKKTQSLAEQRKELEGKISQYEQLMREALMNPDKYQQYRRQYGLDTEQPAAVQQQKQDLLDIANLDPNNLPEDFTVGDLIKSMQGMQEKLVNQAQSKAKEVINQETANRSYNMAVKNHRKDEFFSQNEDIILHIARTDRDLQKMYNPQEGNDHDVLEAAKVKYLERLKGYVAEKEQEILRSAEEKKKAATLRPQKPVQTTTKSSNTSEIAGRIDPNDILASVRNKRPDLY